MPPRAEEAEVRLLKSLRVTVEGRTAPPPGRRCRRNPIGMPFLRIVSHSGLKQTALSLYREQRYLELESGVKRGEKEKVKLDLK